MKSYRTPDRDEVRGILQNWRKWARDVRRDSAEINYYTISPIFRGTKWAKPTPRDASYSEDSALMVEEVLRDMYRWQPKAREWIIRYWICLPSERALAATMKVSRKVVRNAMDHAHGEFAMRWGMLYLQRVKPICDEPLK